MVLFSQGIEKLLAEDIMLDWLILCQNGSIEKWGYRKEECSSF